MKKGWFLLKYWYALVTLQGDRSNPRPKDPTRVFKAEFM